MAENQNTPNPWKLKVFYYDKNDPRVWVPKRIGAFGWTLNYANKLSWLFTLGIIALLAYAIFSGNARVNLP